MRETMRRALLRGITCWALLAAPVVGASMMPIPMAVIPHESSDPSPVKGSPVWLMNKHGCWSGEAPVDMTGVLPGHVVTQDGYRGARVVDKALGQIFNGEKHNLTIYGFCR